MEPSPPLLLCLHVAHITHKNKEVKVKNPFNKIAFASLLVGVVVTPQRTQTLDKLAFGIGAAVTTCCTVQFLKAVIIGATIKFPKILSPITGSYVEKEVGKSRYSADKARPIGREIVLSVGYGPLAILGGILTYDAYYA